MGERSWGVLRSPESKPLNGGANGGFYDPAFRDNKSQPIHRWVPWIAGYSYRFVDDVLNTYGSEKRTRVLDPFAGVGTTLIQARLRGHDVVGFELSPYAGLVCKVKLDAWTTDLKLFEESISDYREFLRTTKTAKRRPPSRFHTRIPFFSKPVERKVLLTLDFIDNLGDKEVRDAFRAALGAVMVSFSNYSYEPSLSSRPGADKPLIENADVVRLVSTKLFQMKDDIEWLHKWGPTQTTADFYIDDFMNFAKHESAKAHLAITSPPYLNNYHYVRNTRPQVWWLGLVEAAEDLQELEERNVGKFWQTVRGGEQIDLAFEHKELRQVLEHIRETRKLKKVYGGPGWSNYVASYFNDCYRFMKVLKAALSHRAIAVIVVGNSIIQGVEVRTDKFLADIGAHSGFEKVRIDRLRDKRVGASIVNSSVRRGTKAKATVSLYESAVVLQRT